MMGVVEMCIGNWNVYAGSYVCIVNNWPVYWSSLCIGAFQVYIGSYIGLSRVCIGSSWDVYWGM